MSILPLEQEIEYPTSDGQPMAEGPEHMQVMVDLIESLKGRYAETPNVWVGGNFFFYYEEGNPKARVSPDVMVAKGVAPGKRRRYLLWQERPPSLVVEVTSLETRRKDEKVKKPLYERVGVEEYVLFDPLGEYLRPSLQGFRRLRGWYQPIPQESDGSLLSRTTGLRLKREGQRLRMVDVLTGEPILWREELEAKVAEEAAGRQAAEARVVELEERLRNLEKERRQRPEP
ncbi:MAG TPA: Uma2 family endonuclease [Thermoanaerobaculia bacterium]|jgi:Uma2 family endonuclease|nr:Uma2 family endonuclease [Thermoanaerobaculia bacterium]